MSGERFSFFTFSGSLFSFAPPAKIKMRGHLLTQLNLVFCKVLMFHPG